MSAYSCSRCKDTGTIKDDASWGENGGCTYVCNCMYGKRVYHQPLPPAPTGAFLLDRADREYQKRIDAGEIAACRHCLGTFNVTDDWDGACGECKSDRRQYDYS